jgi:hypothetical protein
MFGEKEQERTSSKTTEAELYSLVERTAFY